jgi:hypothetical protein
MMERQELAQQSDCPYGQKDRTLAERGICILLMLASVAVLAAVIILLTNC